MKNLNETVFIKGKIIEQDKASLPEGVLCRVQYDGVCNIGELNQNNRLYEKAVWDKVHADENFKHKLESRTLFGHAEHPEDVQSKLDLTSHIVTESFIDDKTSKLVQVFDVLDTPHGRLVNTLLRAGCQVGVSTRAEGELEEAVDEDGNKFMKVIPEAFEYAATDFTADPSTFNIAPSKVEFGVIDLIKKGLSDEKIDKHYACTLLGSMKSKKAKILLESIEKEIEEAKLETGSIVELTSGEYKGKRGKVSGITEGTISVTLDDGTVIAVEDATALQIVPKQEAAVPEIEEPEAPPAEELSAPEEEEEGIPESKRRVKEDVDLASSVRELVKAAKDALNAGNYTQANELLTRLQGIEAAMGDFTPPVEEEEKEEEELKAEIDAEEEVSVEEAKMGVDYVRSVKGAVKIATQALRDKDYEAASKALEDVADDASDAARAAKKMKREIDAKAEAEETSESKIKETEDIKQMYRNAGLPTPDGKGIHTKAFHELAINVAKGYVKGGDSPKEAMDKAYPTAMKQLGKGKAVKKVHRSEAKLTFESFEDLVKYLEKEFESFDETKKMSLAETLDKLIPTTIPKSPISAKRQVRDAKIKEATIRAERDVLDSISKRLNDELDVIERSKGVEVGILRKKFGDLQSSFDKALEKKDTIITGQRNQLGDITAELENTKAGNINDTKKHQGEIDELKNSHQKEMIKNYADKVLEISGLELSEKTRSILGGCTTTKEVDKEIESIRESLRKNALRSSGIDKLKIETELDPETQKVVGAIENAMEGMIG